MSPNPSVPDRVLVVEDDASVRQLVNLILENNGYAVRDAPDGESGLALASKDPPDLVILDLKLPQLSGIEVCTALRKWFRGPILVLSGNGEESTIVRALDCGADDYIVKPFRAAELLARLRAVARRFTTTGAERRTLVVGELRIDLAGRRIESGDREIRLTKTEFEILAVMVQHLDQVVTANVILRHVWGQHHGEYAQTLRVHVGNIRKKIEEDPATPCYLLTEAGVGYRFQAPQRLGAAGVI